MKDNVVSVHAFVIACGLFVASFGYDLYQLSNPPKRFDTLAAETTAQKQQDINAKGNLDRAPLLNKQAILTAETNAKTVVIDAEAAAKVKIIEAEAQAKSNVLLEASIKDKSLWNKIQFGHETPVISSTSSTTQSSCTGQCN
jgi:hypothetical protein